MNASKLAIEKLRQMLVDGGFQTGNHANDLVSKRDNGDDLWLSTSYAGGEFQVAMWTRAPGGVAQDGNRSTVRVCDRLLADYPTYVDDLAVCLVEGEPYTGPGSSYIWED